MNQTLLNIINYCNLLTNLLKNDELYRLLKQNLHAISIETTDINLFKKLCTEIFVSMPIFC